MSYSKGGKVLSTCQRQIGIKPGGHEEKENQAPIPPCRSDDLSKSSTRSMNRVAAIEKPIRFR